MFNNKFGEGDRAYCGQFEVIVLEVNQDNNGEFWYKIRMAHDYGIYRLLSDEVPESALRETL